LSKHPVLRYFLRETIRTIVPLGLYLGILGGLAIAVLALAPSILHKAGAAVPRGLERVVDAIATETAAGRPESVGSLPLHGSVGEAERFRRRAPHQLP
jgi:hypothetical protein